MELEFIKMQLAGRDVILVDAQRSGGVDPASIPGVCEGALDRRRGVGGDVVILVGHTPEHELTVRSFTSRGREEEPTLNELVCAGRYGIDSGLAAGTSARVCGPVRAVAIEALDSRSVLADVGVPLRADGQELVENPGVAYARTVGVDGRDLTFTPVRVGPLQAVAFVPSFDVDIRRQSRGFQEAVPEAQRGMEAPVPDPAQLTYARVSSRRRLLARTWRFGQGEVRSEGYAAAAVAVAAALHGFADRDTIVAARGGDLYVLWSDANNRLYVTGTPEYVFTGTYSIDERRGGGQAVR